MNTALGRSTKRARIRGLFLGYGSAPLSRKLRELLIRVVRLPLLIGCRAFPGSESPRSPAAPRPGLARVGEPIFGGDFLLPARCRRLEAARAAGTNSGHNLGLLFGAEVLPVLAQQAHYVTESIGGLLLAELGLLLFKTSELLLELSAGGGNGVQGELTHMLRRPLSKQI